MNVWELKNEAERIVGEGRVPHEVMVEIAEMGGVDDAADLDHHALREEAARVVGEDRIARDVLSDLLESYGGDEDADRDIN